MKFSKRFLAAVALTAGVGSANAGIPVIDVSNLAQSIQQVIAWGQQYTQMAQQITTMRDQYTQLTNTYNAMTGNRGLGTLLNGVVDQTARRYLPADGTQIGQLSTGVVAGFGSLQATISRYKSSVTSIPGTAFSVGTDAARAFEARVNSMATQQALGEAAYTSTAQRTTDLENMISTIGVADDPKAIAEINARIGAQQALIANEATKLQALNYMQQLDAQRNEQASRDVFAAWGTATLPAISF
jgi:type IV secretion system protein VirB5